MKRAHHLILTAAAVLLLTAAMGALFFFLVDVVVKEVEIRAAGDISTLEYLLEKQGNPADFQSIAVDLAELSDAHILIVDPQARLLADSHIRPESVIAGTYINANLSAARAQTTATSIVRNRLTGELSISVGKLIAVKDQQLVVSFNYQIQEMSLLVRVFLIGFGLQLLLTVAVVYLLTSYALKTYKKPISKLLQHTRGASDSYGGLGKISIDTHNSELLELVDEFNSLNERYNLLITSDNAKYSKINTLLSHISTGIMIINPDNTVSLINPKAEELVDIDKTRLFTGEAAGSEHRGVLASIFEATARVNTGESKQYLTLETAEGRLLDVTIEQMFSKYIPYHHIGALVLIRDVTDIRRLERLKDEFVSNVSHELRTPLTVISGFVQTLANWEMLSAADRQTSLTIIELETQRLKKLISELLVLSRIEGEMDGSRTVPFSPSEAAEEIVRAVRPVADKKHISVQTSIEKTCQLSGRDLWFKQIVMNLLENAVKYSNPQTEIRLELSENDSAQVVLQVTDQGFGIDEEELDKIFDRFYRVEKSRNSTIAGSGLGLSITKLMVEEFGGTITVSSTLGKGSVFTVLLPCVPNSIEGGN